MPSSSLDPTTLPLHGQRNRGERRNDHLARFLQRHVRDGSAVLCDARRLRLRQMVEDIHAGAVLGHKPVRGRVRCPGTVLPLHIPERPVPDGHQVHTGRHRVESSRARDSIRLGDHFQRRAGLGDYAVLSGDAAEHPGDGDPFAEGHVWRFHPEPHGPSCRPPVYYLVFSPPYNVKVLKDDVFHLVS